MIDYRIVKEGPARYSLIRMDESYIRGYVILFDGKSRQECLDMYSKNFERIHGDGSHSTQLTVTNK